jgi:hypothetical protein
MAASPSSAEAFALVGCEVHIVPLNWTLHGHALLSAPWDVSFRHRTVVARSKVRWELVEDKQPCTCLITFSGLKGSSFIDKSSQLVLLDSAYMA